MFPQHLLSGHCPSIKFWHFVYNKFPPSNRYSVRPDVEINGYSMYVGPCAFADVQTCAYTGVAPSAATLYNIQVSLSLPSKARPTCFVTSDTPTYSTLTNHGIAPAFCLKKSSNQNPPRPAPPIPVSYDN